MWMLITLLSCQSKAENETAADTGSDAGFTHPFQPQAVENSTTTGCPQIDGEIGGLRRCRRAELVQRNHQFAIGTARCWRTCPCSYSVKTYRIRYVTQNQGAEIEATGLVTLPVEVESAAPPLLWTHPTTGFTDECAPSAQGLEGAGFPHFMGGIELCGVRTRLSWDGWLGRSLSHVASLYFG